MKEKQRMKHKLYLLNYQKYSDDYEMRFEVWSDIHNTFEDCQPTIILRPFRGEMALVPHILSSFEQAEQSIQNILDDLEEETKQ